MLRKSLLAAAIVAAVTSSTAPYLASSSAPPAGRSAQGAVGAGRAPVAATSVPTVLAWGPSPRNVPSVLDRVETVAVAAGGSHDLALIGVGAVVGWGRNGHHQADVPAALDGVPVTQVAAGEAHSLALTEDGGVVAWGWNRDRQADVPAGLDAVTVTQVAAGGRHSLALTEDGSVVAWGSNRHHQADVPDALDGVVVVQLAAGQARPRRPRPGPVPSHNLALTEDGGVVAWGSNRNHQADVPASLVGVTVTQVAAGGRHSLALTADGTVVAWGANLRGQSDVPAALDGVTVTQVAAGDSHSVALTADGSVVAWGKWRRTRDVRVAVVLEAIRVSAIAAGGRSNLAVGRYEGPDLEVSRRQDGPYGLNNAYDTGGPFDLGGQAGVGGDVVGESFCMREPRRFYVRVHNDAITSESFRLRASSRTPSRIRYHYRGTDVTRRLSSRAGFLLDIPPGRYRTVKMDLTLGQCPYPRPPTTKGFMTAQSVGHPLRIDRVRAKVVIYW